MFLINWGNDWDEIRKSTGSIESIQAEFIQRKEMKILARPIVSKGKFYFQVPKSMRWEYFSPKKSVMLLHNGKVKRYNEKNGVLKKVSGARLGSMRFIISEITMWLKGKFDANPGFKAELKPGRRIVLTPRNRSIARFVKRIELKLSSKPGEIAWVSIQESKEVSTKIEFRNVILNRKIPESHFKEI